MKTLAEDLSNVSILNELEMSKIFGGDNQQGHTTTEDEDAWM